MNSGSLGLAFSISSSDHALDCLGATLGTELGALEGSAAVLAICRSRGGLFLLCAALGAEFRSLRLGAAFGAGGRGRLEHGRATFGAEFGAWSGQRIIVGTTSHLGRCALGGFARTLDGVANPKYVGKSLYDVGSLLGLPACDFPLTGAIVVAATGLGIKIGQADDLFTGGTFPEMDLNLFPM